MPQLRNIVDIDDLPGDPGPEHSQNYHENDRTQDLINASCQGALPIYPVFP